LDTSHYQEAKNVMSHFYILSPAATLSMALAVGLLPICVYLFKSTGRFEILYHSLLI
jgi:hypothetical protein